LVSKIEKFCEPPPLLVRKWNVARNGKERCSVLVGADGLREAVTACSDADLRQKPLMAKIRQSNQGARMTGPSERKHNRIEDLGDCRSRFRRQYSEATYLPDIMPLRIGCESRKLGEDGLGKVRLICADRPKASNDRSVTE
jgi:hypothetical protein